MATSYSSSLSQDMSDRALGAQLSQAQPLSYLSARRPSLSVHNDTFSSSNNSKDAALSSLRNETMLATELDDEDAKLRQSLQIDMKTLVGDSIGNMSISPTSRDIVLAARKGLFIIDLEAPLEVPRFLPQGGTWDVADVQWNPHRSHAEYIVSTSSERLLIWNLLIMGKTSIEHILQSHYRAITDANWHPFDPDIVCSTGIDSWIWAWDIRDPSRPAFGLSAFNAGGTQVKWNRKDGNILASSHLDEILTWDRRKGSIPTSRLKAHDGKIYGIDWSHSSKDELITCSLDKNIKVWSLKSMQANKACVPSLTFNTGHPVWRARDLPFGRGILSLPQRGDALLEMWSYDDLKAPVETFEGHADVVKEYVWRTQTTGDERDLQLITWSKDKTLRFWPVGRDILQKIGVPSGLPPTPTTPRVDESFISFRSPPIGAGYIPALSAPRGQRSILANVRAPQPSFSSNPVLLPHHGSTARGIRHESPRDDKIATRANSVHRALRMQAFDRHEGTMSKGNTRGGKLRMDSSTWLTNVRVEAVGSSRLSSESRPPSGRDGEEEADGTSRRRSTSRSKGEDKHRDAETASSLVDEINAVVKSFGGKVRLERHDLTKNRTCTFSVHGPWGESSSVNVFVRVTFSFPRDYPAARYPDGTPIVEVERNPLISVKRRAFMQRRLREIRENQRPCLEACLKFLLFADGSRRGHKHGIDSGSSSDEEPNVEQKGKKDFSAQLIRDHSNLAEPRSSQGVWGPNGQLVCIFRSLPRLVKAVAQNLTPAATLPSRGRDGVPRLFQSPLQLSDAVRRLALAANDHSYGLYDSREVEDTENILRIMNNLLSFSQPKRAGIEQSRSPENGQTQNNYSLLPKRLTIVYIKDRSPVVGAQRSLAAEYSLRTTDLISLCKTNARIAHRHSRFDHERTFETLAAALRCTGLVPGGLRLLRKNDQRVLSGVKVLLEQLHSELMKLKDVQLLAMFGLILLSLSRQIGDDPPKNTSRSSPQDYFSLKKRRDSPSTPSSRTVSSPTLIGGQSHSSASSRGSWSSLFNSGTVRQLIGGAQDLTPGSRELEKAGQNSPTTVYDLATAAIPVPTADLRQQIKTGPRRETTFRQNSSFGGIAAVTTSERSPTILRPTHSSGPERIRDRSLSLALSPHPSIPEGQVWSILMEERETKPQVHLLLSHDRLLLHMIALGEMLHSWKLFNKHAELMKAVKVNVGAKRQLPMSDGLELVDACQLCLQDIPTSQNGICSRCVRRSTPLCTVCQLPVKGLSHVCTVCNHITHLRCWQGQDFLQCPIGCGCACEDELSPT